MLPRSTKIVKNDDLRSIFTLYDTMNFEQLRIADYTHWELCLHNPHYYLGSVYLWAKRDGDIGFLATTDEEQVAFFDVAIKVKRALIDLCQFAEQRPATCMCIYGRDTVARGWSTVLSLSIRIGAVCSTPMTRRSASPKTFCRRSSGTSEASFNPNEYRRKSSNTFKTDNSKS